jgi:hypothetical protein
MIFKSKLRKRIEARIKELELEKLSCKLEEVKYNATLNPEDRIKYILKRAKYQDEINHLRGVL